MTADPNLPCVIGVAQRTVRPGDGPAPEPLRLWTDVAESAAADAGTPDLLRRLDSVQVVYCQSWQYDDPVARLTELLGAQPRHRRYSGIGGTVPQLLLADAAQAIAAGEMDAALVVGAEALATRRALRRTGERPAWSHPPTQRRPFPLEQPPDPAEVAHEVFQAWLTFALLDVARRAARGDPLTVERASRGALLAPMTRLAAANPYAWFPVERTAEELVTPTAENRFVGWPYTKYTVSVMDVDMAAAVLLTSRGLADQLGVPADRRVYLRSCAYGEDAWHLAERDDLAGSPAMRLVSAAALQRAGVRFDDITLFDLYSCFASSLRFACDALGLDPADPRGLTVTGGLPFAGGPGSNYLLHAVAGTVAALRRTPGHALLSGVGMHMTKHAYAVWSTEPGPLNTGPADDLAAELAAQPRRPVQLSYTGPATVAAYSVVHGRAGEAESGLCLLDTPDGSRAYARVREPDLLADAESRELVGQRVDVRTDDGVNLARW